MSVRCITLLIILSYPAWATGWTSNRLITIDHTKVSTADQTNFPVFWTTRCDSLGAAVTTNGQTAWTLTTGQCTQNNDYIQVDTEIVQITAGGGTTSITVTRAQKGTSAATHLINAQITNMFLSNSANGGTVSSTNGYDIAFFTDTACTIQVPFERTQWTSSTGLATFHFLRPTLSHSTDGLIYICYNNTNISGDLQSPRDVWVGYAAVYHMTPGTQPGVAQGVYGDIYDSSLNYNNMSAFTTIPFTSSNTTSPMNGGWQLNGLGGWNRSVSFGHSGFQSGTTGPLAIEGWFNLQSKTGSYVMFGQGNNTANQHVQMYWQNDGKLYMDIGQTPSTVPFCTFTNDSNWHYWVAVGPSGTLNANTFSLYLDGASCTNTANSFALNISSLDVAVGSSVQAHANDFPGELEEVRFSNVVRAASWVATQYNNQSAPATFFKSLGTASVPTGSQGQTSYAVAQ